MFNPACSRSLCYPSSQPWSLQRSQEKACSYVLLPDDYLNPIYEALEKRVQREVEETALAAKEISLLCEEMLFCFPKGSTPSPFLSSSAMADLLEEAFLRVMEKADFLFKILDCGVSNVECLTFFTKLPKNQAPSILAQFNQNPTVKKQNRFLRPAFFYICKIDQIAIQTLRPTLLSRSIIKSSNLGFGLFSLPPQREAASDSKENASKTQVFTERSPVFVKRSALQISTAALKRAAEIEIQRKIGLFLTALKEIHKIAVEMGEFAAKANSQ